MSYEFTENDLIMAVLALLACAGVAGFVFRKGQKLIAWRNRCIDVAMIASKEGFDMTASLLKACGTGDLVEIAKEIEAMHKMFTTPGLLALHLDELFTKQLVKRMGDEAKRGEILKAAEAFVKGEADKKAAILKAAQDDAKLAAMPTAAAATAVAKAAA